MYKSKLDSRCSIDENTPDNSQDSITLDDRFIPRGCVHEIECDAAPVDVKEEQSAEESELGMFTAPVYHGVGFHRTSNFQDSEYGEPARMQHLRLDFSPIEGVDDNAFIVNKCNEFWAFVENNPSIRGLRYLPVPDSPEPVTELKTITNKSDNSNVTSTAVDWLKQGQGLMREAFSTEQKKRYCDVTGNSSDNCPKWHSRKGPTHGHHAGSSDTAPRRSVSRRKHLEPSRSSSLPSEEVTRLCKELEAWDLSHPKSMEPPGHPPNLSDTLMQRLNLC